MHIVPLHPPDPAQAIVTCEQFLRRAEALLAQATTPIEQLEAELWVDNATRNLTKWRAVAERAVTR